jgi:hypothetical protein
MHAARRDTRSAACCRDQVRATINGVDHDEALVVQRRHEQRLLATPGVTEVAVKLRGGRLVLVVGLDPDAPVPPELKRTEIDGLPLVVERRRYEPQ